MSERPLNIPVILGTSRKGRASVHAANLLASLLNRRAGVRSEVIDIADVPLPVDDAGEAIKSAPILVADRRRRRPGDRRAGVQPQLSRACSSTPSTAA